MYNSLFCFVFNVHMMLKVDLLLVIVLWTISYSAILVVDFFRFLVYGTNSYCV